MLDPDSFSDLPLHVREIPFDFAKVMSFETAASLVQTLGDMPGGKAQLFLELSMSMSAERAEHMIHYVHKQYGFYSDAESSRDFIRQELRHAGYHHVLNRIIEPRYIPAAVLPIPKINHLWYPLHATDELKWLNQTDLDARKKDYMRTFGAFETQFLVYALTW